MSASRSATLTVRCWGNAKPSTTIVHASNSRARRSDGHLGKIVLATARLGRCLEHPVETTIDALRFPWLRFALSWIPVRLKGAIGPWPESDSVSARRDRLRQDSQERDAASWCKVHHVCMPVITSAWKVYRTVEHS